MKIKKTLLLILSLLFIPCILTSCSFVKTENQSDSTVEIVEPTIDYNDINQMNVIYDQTETGHFLEKSVGPSSSKYGQTEGKVKLNATFEIEGGAKYATTYGEWAIQNFVELELENYLSNNPNPKYEDKKMSTLTSEEIQEWLENCYLLLEEKSDEVSSCLYVTITCHVRNIIIESLRIYYN